MGNFLWSKYPLELPHKCVFCKERIDIPLQDNSGLLMEVQSHWPPVGTNGEPVTSMSLQDFFTVVEQRQNEEQWNLRYIAEQLAQCPLKTIDYCNGNTQCPEMRACPKCKMPIYFECGCKNMYCTSCEHSFCFL